MTCASTAEALVYVPGVVGDVSNDLQDAPEAAPARATPLRIVVGEDTPVAAAPPTLDELEETPAPSEDDELPVQVSSETPTPPPLTVTPRLSASRPDDVG